MDINRDNRLDLLLLGADGAHVYFETEMGFLHLKASMISVYPVLQLRIDVGSGCE